METQTRNRKSCRRGLTVAGLRRWLIYQPLAILLAILMLPVLSWVERSGGAYAPFRASAQNTTIADITPPTAPSSLTANVDPFVQPSGALDLSWTASTD